MGMKLHESLVPSMRKAAISLYEKARRCAWNSECEKKMLIVPTDDEITLLHWLIQDFAKENDFEL